MELHLDQIDWYRFLQRPRLSPPEPELLRTFRNQRILITGAGGSIASALALRLADLAPRQLVLLEASESHLFALQREWNDANTQTPVSFLLGNIADPALLEECFDLHRPQLVFHAAAFKHVPLLEEQPLAAIANNIGGTQDIVAMASRFGARVVLLSTDKAVAPTSVMGATKRVAEQIVLSAGGTVLRLGNVLASRDSVAEVFADQIAQGGPITVTDPAARRYFLTLEEAVDLLLAAALDSESPALLVPGFDQPHFIADLAQFLAREASPDRAIEIQFTHLRPGDKEAEQLWSAGESALPAKHPGMLSIESPALTRDKLHSGIAELRAALSTRDVPACVAQLCRMVPDYEPSLVLRATAAPGSTRVSQ